MPSPLVQALLAELRGDDQALVELAAALAPHLPSTASAGRDPDELLSPAQIADELGMHPRTVTRAMQDRELEARKTRGRWRARRRDVDAWLEREDQAAAPRLRAARGPRGRATGRGPLGDVFGADR